MKMLLLMIKLSLSLTFLMVVSACTYNPKKLTPSFPDTDRMTFREYHVKETKPTIQFEFTAEYPLKDYPKSRGGVMCLPVPQALEIKRKWENRKNRNDQEDEEMLTFQEPEFFLSPLEIKKPVSEKIKEEKEILSGVEYENN